MKIQHDALFLQFSIFSGVSISSLPLWTWFLEFRKVNRKVQEEPQAQEDCINHTIENHPERPLSYKYFTLNPQTGSRLYLSQHTPVIPCEVFQSGRFVVNFLIEFRIFVSR